VRRADGGTGGFARSLGAGAGVSPRPSALPPALLGHGEWRPHETWSTAPHAASTGSRMTRPEAVPARRGCRCPRGGPRRALGGAPPADEADGCATTAAVVE